MIEILFKNIKLTKENLHVITYSAEESKGDALIKSNISICVESAEIDITESFENIVIAGQEIAKREYARR